MSHCMGLEMEFSCISLNIRKPKMYQMKVTDRIEVYILCHVLSARWADTEKELIRVQLELHKGGPIRIEI